MYGMFMSCFGIYGYDLGHFYRHSFDEEAVDQSRLKPCLHFFFQTSIRFFSKDDGFTWRIWQWKS